MMFEILLRQQDQQEQLGKLAPGSYIVGSSEQSQIRFTAPGISDQHCQFIVTETNLQVKDLGSSNGTFIDGVKLGSELVEASIGSTIAIPSIQIFVKGLESRKIEVPHVDVEEVKPVVASTPVANTPVQDESDKEVPILRISGVPDSARPLVQEIKKSAHVELLQRLNLKRMAVSGASEDELDNKAKSTIHEILTELTIPLPAGVSLEVIEKELVHEAIGLGPLEDLIARDDISEIMVNGPDKVYVEHKGEIYKTDTAFADDSQVQAAIERIVAPLGRRIDESSPMVDARLKDGSRVNAIIPPLSLIGPTLTIRKFAKVPLVIQNLIDYNSISADMAIFLDICVKLRKNIIISGGTGSGKTTLLNVLSNYLPNSERIVTIEDAAELQLKQEHVVRLESRPPNIEGKGEVGIRDLVKNSLRMRPDRIVIGECRGGEALDMLQAMNTGHDGSLTTIHANTPRDALARLETLVLMSGFDLPLRAIREQIASAIAIIVQISREKDGSRKTTHVSEITKMEGEIITLQDIFVFKHEGWTPDNKTILGSYVATGNIPSFMEDIERANLNLDISIFRPDKQG